MIVGRKPATWHWAAVAAVIVIVIVIALVLPARAAAQAAGDDGESTPGGELRREIEHLKETCGSLKTVAGCATTLITGRPLKIAFASIAPGNGPAVGGAFGLSQSVGEGWRTSWNSDAVRTLGGSWRAGTYLTLVRTPTEPTVGVVTDPSAATAATALAPRPRSTITLYAQHTSIQDVSFYGLGNASLRENHTSYGESQSIFGASLVAPISALGRANLSLLAELNGRFVSIRDGNDDALPSALTQFTASDAPGLAEEDLRFLQAGGGARVTPRLHRLLRLNYLVTAHRYAASDRRYSFTRVRLDLQHEIGLFRRSGEPDIDPEATNECFATPNRTNCLGSSRDLGGTIQLRALLASTAAADGAAVPVYFQPSIGGSDIQGLRTLSSFDNYRFRAPHTLVFQQSLEHAIWGPVGAWVRADQGMVAVRAGAVGLGGLKKTLTIGATVRAAGAPLLVLSYAMGGGEGRRAVISFNAALLGGGARPSLD